MQTLHEWVYLLMNIKAEITHQIHLLILLRFLLLEFRAPKLNFQYILSFLGSNFDLSQLYLISDDYIIVCWILSFSQSEQAFFGFFMTFFYLHISSQVTNSIAHKSILAIKIHLFTQLNTWEFLNLLLAKSLHKLS